MYIVCVYVCMVQVGVAAEPTYEDYLWATSIFWSRGLALPITYTDTPQQQQQQQEDGGLSSSSSSSGSSDSTGMVRVKVLEGLVPGLDFANHNSQVCLCVCGGQWCCV